MVHFNGSMSHASDSFSCACIAQSELGITFPVTENNWQLEEKVTDWTSVVSRIPVHQQRMRSMKPRSAITKQNFIFVLVLWICLESNLPLPIATALVLLSFMLFKPQLETKLHCIIFSWRETWSHRPKVPWFLAGTHRKSIRHRRDKKVHI
jgi:hypothetical protein